MPCLKFAPYTRRTASHTNKRLVLAAKSISLPSQDSTAEHSMLLLLLQAYACM